MSANVGFAAQNTMLPVACAGAMVILLVLTPPDVPQTLMVISLSWTCIARFVQMSLGIAQTLLEV